MEMNLDELLKGILAGPSQDDRSRATNMGILQTGLGLLARKNLGEAGMMGVQAGQGVLDKSRQDQMQKLQAVGTVTQLQKQMQDAALAKRKNDFFSPAGQAPFMTGGAPEIQQPPDEIGGGPGRAAVAPTLDFNKMLASAASQNFVPPETYANHLAQREQAKAQLAATQQAKVEALAQQYRMHVDRMDDLSQSREQRAEDARRADATRRELAMFMAANRQPREEPAPVAVVTLDGKGVELVSRSNAIGRTPAGLDADTQGRIAGGKATARGAAQAAQATAADQKSAMLALRTAGYDPTTGKDRISELIQSSTSGAVERGAAAIPGAFGYSTSGMKALRDVESTANTIVLELMNRKLGAGISNADRDFIVTQLGDVGNAMKPSGERLSAWRSAKNRMIDVGLHPNAGGAPAAPSAPSSDMPPPGAVRRRE